MKLNCIFILLILVFSAYTCVYSQTQEPLVAKSNAQRLRGVEKMKAVVEKFTPQYEALGFNSKTFESNLANKLKENNCYDENATEYLYLNITPIIINERLLSVSVQLSFNRPVYFTDKNEIFLSMANLWQSSSIMSIPSGSLNCIDDMINKLTDKFMEDWHKSKQQEKKNDPQPINKDKSKKKNPIVIDVPNMSLV